MGFTVAGPDRFLGCGHPDLRENLPALLGLMESTDRGQTWHSLSLLGEVDFHAIEAKHGQVYGYDATSETFLVSPDGRTWQRRAQVPLADYTVAPTRADLVLATGKAGLLRSTDEGRSFLPLPGPPGLDVLDWTDGGLFGLAADGSVWVSGDSGDSWQRRGDIGSKPQAVPRIPAKVEPGAPVLAARADGQELGAAWSGGAAAERVQLRVVAAVYMRIAIGRVNR